MDSSDGNEAITVVRVPPDDCPNCNRKANPPERTNSHGSTGDTIDGWYRCPDCDYIWDTTWRIEPVTPSREG